jgi:hypothetical protein
MRPTVLWNSNLVQTISLFLPESNPRQSLLSAAAAVVVAAIGPVVVEPVVFCMDLPIR